MHLAGVRHEGSHSIAIEVGDEAVLRLCTQALRKPPLLHKGLRMQGSPA